MDSGWAVVIGASIGFIGSLLAGTILPWIRASADAKRITETTRAEKLDDAVRNVIQAMSESFMAPAEASRDALHVRVLATIIDLELLLDSPSSLDASILYDVAQALSTKKVSTDYKVKCFAAIALLLPQWRRGEYAVGKLRSEYDAMVNARPDTESADR